MLMHGASCLRSLQQWLSSSMSAAYVRMTSRVQVNEFSALVTSAGYKPTPMAALGRLRAVDRKAAFKISLGLRIHLRSTRQSHYSHHQRAAAGDKSWNDARLLLDATAAAAAHQAHKRSKAVWSLRIKTIRACYKV